MEIDAAWTGDPNTWPVISLPVIYLLALLLQREAIAAAA